MKSVSGQLEINKLYEVRHMHHKPRDNLNFKVLLTFSRR